MELEHNQPPDGATEAGDESGGDEERAPPLAHELVTLEHIEARIHALRTDLSAHRNELDELQQGRLSAQTIEVLLTDLLDIWTWTGQLVGLERQARDERRVIANEIRDLTDEIRALNTLQERRIDRRAHWQRLLRARRHDQPPSPPLADLRFSRDEPEAPG